jgi:aryl-alcohol dehydrogenase-like predicted oxidoreductase
MGVFMSFVRPLPGTGLLVSALGLGTVKFGRNTGVKYPAGFELPDDAAIRDLLSCARDLGINLLDTAPAYGSSEERIGALLENRQEWVLVTKVGEDFANGISSFDFSRTHTRTSIERSLKRLKTDWIDLVLIHSDGNDETILRQGECVEELGRCKTEGLVRAIGMSAKTDRGGMAAISELDVAMVTWNLQQQDRQTVALARELDKGILVKKGLLSGHVSDSNRDIVQESMDLAFSEPGIHCMVTGTINQSHLRSNVEKALLALARYA